MSTLKKKLLTASYIVSGIGLLIILILAIYTKFDIKRFNNVQETKKVVQIDKKFSNISIDAGVSDVKIILTEDNTKTITLINPTENDTIEYIDGTLTIVSKKAEEKGTLLNPKFNFRDKGDADIMITIPATQLGSLDIKTTSGDVEIKDYFCIKAETVSVTTESGKIDITADVSEKVTAVSKSGEITLSGFKSDKINAETESGKILLKDIDTKGDINVKSVSGNISTENIECNDFVCTQNSGSNEIKALKCWNALTVTTESGKTVIKESDAFGIITITSNSGSVDVQFASDKVYSLKSESGKISKPSKNVTEGGMCNITTKSGSIKAK